MLKAGMLYRRGQSFGCTKPVSRHYTIAGALLIAALFLLSSCTQDKDGDGIADKKDKCPAIPGKNKDGCPDTAPQIGTVRLFMDRSGSMKGYYNGGSSFVDNIHGLISQLEDTLPVKNIWWVSDSMKQFDGTARQFCDQFVAEVPQADKSSKLDKIFEQIAALTGKHDISILVSDGILSFSDKEIKKNRYINKQRAYALSDNIMAVFNDLHRHKAFGVSLYAFRSSFSGTYYDYQNGKTVLSNTERPYYIWVLGQKDCLRQFDAVLARFAKEADAGHYAGFKPAAELHFGTDTGSITTAHIFSSLYRRGKWQLSGNGKGLENIGNEPATFSLAADLGSLPAYAQQEAYLAAHIQPDVPDCRLEIISIKKKTDADAASLRSKRDKESFAHATHIITCSLKQMQLPEASGFIRLPAQQDDWYLHWSCDDDLHIRTDCSGQTFAFRYLVAGFIKAYQGDAADYIAIPVSFKQ